MLLEDKAGEALREIDLKERLLAKMAKTMGVSVDELRATPVLDAGVRRTYLWRSPTGSSLSTSQRTGTSGHHNGRLVEEKTKSARHGRDSAASTWRHTAG